MYEHRTKRLLSRREFLLRQGNHLLAAAALVVIALAIGAVGFHFTEHQPWLDSAYSATMLLTCMGLSEKPTSDPGKLFASLYAFFAALIFLTASSILIAPGLHRFFHKLHLERKAHGD